MEEKEKHRQQNRTYRTKKYDLWGDTARDDKGDSMWKCRIMGMEGGEQRIYMR